MSSSRQSTDSLRAKVRHSINKVRDQRRGEDNEEDATGIAEDNPGYAQQSLYGLIGATHSKSGLHLQGHFHPDSGSESGGETETEGSGRPDKIPSTAAGLSSDSRSNLDEQRRSPTPESGKDFDRS
ncbi:hypothetical protein LTR02_014611 [Friedmanniomyces endolithicus]|nr:hypothetical protein LTR02_014611 [Friedmanniomyces endolithicus]